MLHLFEMVALTLCDLFVAGGEPDPDEQSDVVRGCTLLFLAQVANVGFVLMVWLPQAMDALARHRNVTVLFTVVLGLPFYVAFKRLVVGARKTYGDDEVAASKARQRWRLPVLLYLVISLLLFIGEIAILASRKGTLS